MSKIAIEISDYGEDVDALADLVDKAALGDEIILTRDGEAVAQLVPCEEGGGSSADEGKAAAEAFRQRVINVPQKLDDALRTAADALGQPENTLIVRALERYLAGSGIRPPRVTEPEEVEEIIAATAGMWKNRTDLPDLRELRAEWERRFDRVFPGHE